MNSVKDITIIGGGIVGLATALEAVRRHPGLAVRVLEKEDRPAAHQTGHNSGVIHSGIYYKPGSLKARLCVEGAREMTRFCDEQGLPYRVTGKVVVATSSEELPRLDELHRRGQANGVPGLKVLSPAELKEIEPHAAGIRALWVPGTGIADYRAVAARVAGLVGKAGGEIRTGVKVLSARRRNGRWVLETTQGEVSTDFFINCAGLFSDRVARAAGARPTVKIVPFRGEYYKLTEEGARLVRTLIYPVPDPSFPFLGVHFTHFIEGGVEAGPNAVLALMREGYRKSDVSLRDAAETLAYGGFWRLARRHARTGFMEMVRSFSKAAFLKSLQRLVPAVRKEFLIDGGAGVRAQALSSNGLLVDDFQFVREEGALHVLNAPSPAATASFPIGRMILESVALPDARRVYA